MKNEFISRNGREWNNLYPIQQKFIKSVLEICKSDNELNDFISNRRTGKTEALLSLNAILENQSIISSETL